MLATEYAEYYKIKPQHKDESDLAFRGRVAGALRDMGRTIEAHEAHCNERYETSDNVMTGIIGAVSQAFHGVDYGSKGEQQIGNDVAVGTISQSTEGEMSPEMVLAAIQLLG